MGAARPWRPASRCAAVVVGPGLGRDAATAAEVRRLVAESPVPVVVDADGLFALGRVGGDDSLQARLAGGPHPPRRRVRPADGRPTRARTGSPRPGGWPPPRARWRCSRARPRRWPTRPAGCCWACPAPPPLATAGTGDVLSGMIGAMVARGVAPLEAAALAAHVHGRAGGLGPVEGLVAGDLPDLVARVLSGMRSDRRRGGPPWLTAGGRPGPTSTSMPCATTPRSWSGWSDPAALCAVVKADGYGHGAVPVARAALEGGARWLAVALVEEGVALREAGIEAPILLLSEPPAEAMAEAVARRLVPTVYSTGGLELLSAAADGDRRRRSRSTSRWTPACTGSGADPADGAGPGRPPSPPIPGWPSARCGPTWPWPRATSPDDRRVHRRAARAVRRRAGRPGRGRPPAPDDPRGQLGRRHRRPRGPARHGALRHRRLRGGPDPGPGRRDRRGHRGRAAPAGPLAPGPGDLDARPRRRGAALLRPAAAAGAALDGGHRAHRLRRRGPPPPLRPGRRGADRRGPPAAGRSGDHGPDGGRLRPGRDRPRWRWATRWSCSAARATEEITADEWAGLLGTISYEVLCDIGARVPRLTAGGVRVAGLSPAGRRRTRGHRQYHSAVAPGTDLADTGPGGRRLHPLPAVGVPDPGGVRGRRSRRPT